MQVPDARDEVRDPADPGLERRVGVGDHRGVEPEARDHEEDVRGPGVLLGEGVLRRVVRGGRPGPRADLVRPAGPGDVAGGLVACRARSRGAGPCGVVRGAVGLRELQDARPPDVDHAVRARDNDAQGLVRVGDGQVEVAGEEVSRAERHEAHGLARADHALGDGPDRAVAADRDDDVGAAGESLTGLPHARVLDRGLEPQGFGQVGVGAHAPDRPFEVRDRGLGGVRDERDELTDVLREGLGHRERRVEASSAALLRPDRHCDGERDGGDGDRRDPQPHLPTHVRHGSARGAGGDVRARRR